jgi:hypothetical protein
MKLNFLILFLVACIISACKQSTPPSEKNRQTAIASVHAFEKADLAAMKRFCGPGFVDYGNGEDKPWHNLDSMKVAMDAFNAAFGGQRVSNLQAFSSGDTVIVTDTWSGTFKSPLMGIKPNGKTFSYPDAEILVFNKDGLIISHRAIQSNGTAFAQLGIAMPKN